MFSFAKIPAAALSSLFAALLVPSFSTRLPRRWSSRQIIASQIEGTFAATLTTGSGICPSSILISGIGSLAQGSDYIVTSASKISIGGFTCDESTLIIVNSELAQNETRLSALDIQADLVTKLSENRAASTTLNGIDNANINVGFFDKKVACGTFTFPSSTILFFLSTGPGETQVIAITAAPNAPPKTITIQSNSQAFISTDGATICIAQEGDSIDDKVITIPQATPDGGDGDRILDEDNESNGNAAATIEPNEERECFPASALVELESGIVVPISTLNIGNAVKTGVDTVSEVILFTHREQYSRNEFVLLTTEAGHEITLSSGHYVHVDSHGRLKAAREVEIGDSLLLSDKGIWSFVTEKKNVQATGLYNPQTVDGNLAVNGIVSSTYTTTVHPRFAHKALMVPVRWLYNMPFGATRRLLGSAFASGNPRVAEFLPRGPDILVL